MKAGRFRGTTTWPYLARLGVLAVIYIVTAKLGLSLAFSTQQVTTVWPPTGIALAALLLLGFRYWPGVLVGAFVANILTDETVFVAAAIAVGNTLEALTGTYLLRRVVKFNTSFTNASDFFSLLILSGVISTAIAATIGTSALGLGDLLSHSYISTWLVWWVGDMMGALVFAPLILIFANNKFRPLRKMPIEASCLVLISIALCTLIFRHGSNPGYLFPYLIFPLIIWAGLRFTQAGAAIIVTLVAAVAIWGTVDQRGPFNVYLNVERNLILLHTFIIVSAVTAMLTAVISSKQQQTEQALRRRNEKLKESNRRIDSLLKGAMLNRPFTKLRTRARARRPKQPLS